MTLRAVIVALISTGVAGCGAKSTTTSTPGPMPPVAVTPPALPPDMVGSFAPVGWLLGDWHAAEGGDAVHWVAADGTLYGVRFAGGSWRVMIIDDGDGKADKADGLRRHIDLGEGLAEIEQREVKAEDGYVRFGTGGAEIGISIEYRLDLEQLVVTESVGPERREEHATELVGRSGRSMPPAPVRYRRTSDDAAPELEAADRAFDADTAAEGVAGWVKWFAPDGVLWRGERFAGRDAIGAKLQPTLETGALRWQPVASRMLGDGIGFTVGTATWTAKADAAPSWRGSYVTIWRKQADGTWKVAYDTGRTAQPAM
jgi:ketosteroid isomerase-like protein